eukprot:TRINITY_DN16513_c0_g1_i1.p1 TRINITY_DN16513_c0_g1~~TRINITY_DN16513_c0_g1_i1.p1  ORF type:complete len:281 (-),score=37.43 TRINITY_DN16513_c0_g1_i1:473-1315(-)
MLGAALIFLVTYCTASESLECSNCEQAHAIGSSWLQSSSGVSRVKLRPDSSEDKSHSSEKAHEHDVVIEYSADENFFFGWISKQWRLMTSFQAPNRHGVSGNYALLGMSVHQSPARLGLATILVWGIFAMLFAFVYVKVTPFPPLKKPGKHNLVRNDWHFSLFFCYEEPLLCVLAFIFPPIAWAQNMRLSGVTSFTAAFALMLCMCVLSNFYKTLLIVICLMLTYNRQKLRSKFKIANGGCGTVVEDCCTATFCACCLLVQEARQLEQAYQAGHPSVVCV